MDPPNREAQISRAVEIVRNTAPTKTGAPTRSGRPRVIRMSKADARGVVAALIKDGERGWDNGPLTVRGSVREVH